MYTSLSLCINTIGRERNISELGCVQALAICMILLSNCLQRVQFHLLNMLGLLTNILCILLDYLEACKNDC